jgi:outer membrane protein assembly factor BamD
MPARPLATKALFVGALGLLGPATVGALAGCSESTPPPKSALEYAENARREYEAGVRAIESETWEVAAEKLGEVRNKYSYSRYARLAELRLADANLAQNKYAEAITGYKSFAHDYPNDPEVPYARFRVAKAQYESVSQSVLMPPLEERDLAAVNDALRTIRDFQADYPTSPHDADLRYMRAVVVGLLARHELYVARFYLREENFQAAITRCHHALRAFGRTGLEAEALVLLGEILMKDKRRAEARQVLARVLSEFPTSPFVEPARRLLSVLGTAPGGPRESAN